MRNILGGVAMCVAVVLLFVWVRAHRFPTPPVIPPPIIEQPAPAPEVVTKPKAKKKVIKKRPAKPRKKKPHPACEPFDFIFNPRCGV